MNLKLHELKTAALFCSVDDSRRAIMGVRFIAPNRMVSTCGRILVVIETEADNEPLDTPPFTLKSSVIARLPDGRDGISVIKDGNDAAIRIPSLEVEFRFNDAFIDLDYPKYHQVIPEESDSKVVPVNGDYLAKIERAADLFSRGAHIPVIWARDTLSPLEFFIDGAPNFYGVLMGLNPGAVASDNDLSVKLKAERKAQ